MIGLGIKRRIMAENMMCSDHKSTNKVFRNEYDRIFKNSYVIDKAIDKKKQKSKEEEIKNESV